ncbi:MAG: glycosyltransferase family 2 protein [Candidatus Sumerlaeota bacterium]|nr:glycosyltransferase family 2 protein [Candidatus Sumerlaeota bacterium]
MVIPVYNSHDSLELLTSRIDAMFKTQSTRYEVVFVDDCSPDGSWEILKKIKCQYAEKVKIIRLRKNSGQHNAILCGFAKARGEIIVTMDDDLQNPPEEIPRLIASVEEGYDLAIGAYDSKKHARVRNFGGMLIDSIQRRIFRLPPDFQLTSFRAIRRPVIELVISMGGVFPYVTCMLLSNVSSYVNVPVRHEPRSFGRSNYNLKRSLRLAANLIISYSNYPLYFVGIICVSAFLFSVTFASFVFIRAFLGGGFLTGWASTIIFLSFFNVILILCLLICLVYISQINQQLTRTRISYSIREIHE